MALPLSAAHASVFVSAGNSTLTEIAMLQAGMDYRITVTGTADLLVGFNGGVGATFNADGKPTYAFPSPLASMSPNGSATDPQTGLYGSAGPGILIGSLVGTFFPNPTGYDQVFTIGTSTLIRPLSNETLYAIINDDYYPNNNPLTGYNVSVSSVPLPATLPVFGMALAALGVVGAYRRKAHKTAR